MRGSGGVRQWDERQQEQEVAGWEAAGMWGRRLQGGRQWEYGAGGSGVGGSGNARQQVREQEAAGAVRSRRLRDQKAQGAGGSRGGRQQE